MRGAMQMAEQQPHEAFADAVREGVVGGAVLVASGEMPELTITIRMKQGEEGIEQRDDGLYLASLQLSVEFDPPVS